MFYINFYFPISAKYLMLAVISSRTRWNSDHYFLLDRQIHLLTEYGFEKIIQEKFMSGLQYSPKEYRSEY